LVGTACTGGSQKLVAARKKRKKTGAKNSSALPVWPVCRKRKDVKFETLTTTAWTKTRGASDLVRKRPFNRVQGEEVIHEKKPFVLELHKCGFQKEREIEESWNSQTWGKGIR